MTSYVTKKLKTSDEQVSEFTSLQNWKFWNIEERFRLSDLNYIDKSSSTLFLFNMQ